MANTTPNKLEKVHGYAIMVWDYNDQSYVIHSYWLPKDQPRMENVANKITTDHKIENKEFYYSEDTDTYYGLPYINEILVSPPQKEDILKKLTPIERKVLGL